MVRETKIVVISALNFRCTFAKEIKTKRYEEFILLNDVSVNDTDDLCL